MFPRLRQTVLARADVFVELVTLGEYGLDERGAPMPLAPAERDSALSDETTGSAGVAGAPAHVAAGRAVAPCAAPGRPRDRRRDRCATDRERRVTAPGGGAPARP